MGRVKRAEPLAGRGKRHAVRRMGRRCWLRPDGSEKRHVRRVARLASGTARQGHTGGIRPVYEAGCGQRARAATTIHTQTALRWRYPRHELCINAHWRVMIRCQKSDFQFMPIIAPCMPPRTGSGCSVSRHNGGLESARWRAGCAMLVGWRTLA